ncbi:SCO family protein [Flavobacteriales bacterium]|nr:SCO family protein [Flavobacteriales bacterium]
MGERHSTPRRPLRRFFLVVALPGLPLLLLLLLGKGMRHEFSDLDYFDHNGNRITTAQDARRLPQFSLLDQWGKSVNRSSLEGTFWLVAAMTTDTTTSPQLAAFTQQLLWANWRYRDEPDVGLLCLTLDAVHDTPKRLQDYVEQNERYNRFPDKWRFLTGDQKAIDRIIGEGLGIPRDPADPFNVATLLLIDDKGYVRQKYLASSEHEIGDAVEDIALLKKRKKEREKRERDWAAAPPLPFLGPKLGEAPFTVPKFSLTDQDSAEFSHRDLEGKVRLVDAFFTSCPTICPVISSQLARVHDQLWAAGLQDDVRIISHTVDPQNDTPERMKAYSERLGADAAVWKFLTGPEEDLYPLLQEGYLLTALASDTAAGGFFHSDQVVLVDSEGHLRGSYDGTRTSEVDQMLNDVMQVLAQQKASTAAQIQP